MVANPSPEPPRLTPSFFGHALICAAIETAVEVAEARRTNPSAFPLIPQDDVAEHLTRKTLAQLMNVGLIDEAHAPALFAASTR